MFILIKIWRAVFVIPLYFQGTFSVFNLRKLAEYDMEVGKPVFIIPDASPWNPHYELFTDDKASFTNYREEVSASSH